VEEEKEEREASIIFVRFGMDVAAATAAAAEEEAEERE